MKNAVKITMTVLGLIALYLILANGAEFNTALKTLADSAIRGTAVLQGRTTAVAA